MWATKGKLAQDRDLSRMTIMCAIIKVDNKHELLKDNNILNDSRKKS